MEVDLSERTQLFSLLLWVIGNGQLQQPDFVGASLFTAFVPTVLKQSFSLATEHARIGKFEFLTCLMLVTFSKIHVSTLQELKNEKYSERGGLNVLIYKY